MQGAPAPDPPTACQPPGNRPQPGARLTMGLMPPFMGPSTGSSLSRSSRSRHESLARAAQLRWWASAPPQLLPVVTVATASACPLALSGAGGPPPPAASTPPMAEGSRAGRCAAPASGEATGCKVDRPLLLAAASDACRALLWRSDVE